MSRSARLGDRDADFALRTVAPPKFETVSSRSSSTAARLSRKRPPDRSSDLYLGKAPLRNRATASSTNASRSSFVGLAEFPKTISA